MVKPIMDRVLARRIARVESTEKLIEIPDQYQQKSNRCEVIALGDFVVLGDRAYPIDQFLAVGDTIIIGDYNVEDIKVDGQDLVLVSVHDIRGKDVADAS
jgi:co-chaperonin GroES (HSP10)